MDNARKIVTKVLIAGAILATGSQAQDVEWDTTGSYVGVGTGSPEAKLHVKTDEYAYTRPLLIENTSGIGFSGFSLKIASDSWIDFNNSGGNFRINVDGIPGAEFEVRPNGNATVSGALTQNSDVNAKRDIVAIRQQDVLARVMQLPISEWSYKDDPDVRHVGPMAQDFYRLFELGGTDSGISSIDTGGVALAAIQGLQAQLEDKADQLEQFRNENEALRAELQYQDQRMTRLEAALSELKREASR
ncbi:MAG: tail fiber domain-containing protein [Halieaceae bacterium]|jgi:hypothetical protein|nr:tail fiber domain-containing protein [Halieaceae bacterium]